MKILSQILFFLNMWKNSFSNPISNTLNTSASKQEWNGVITEYEWVSWGEGTDLNMLLGHRYLAAHVASGASFDPRIGLLVRGDSSSSSLWSEALFLCADPFVTIFLCDLPQKVKPPAQKLQTKCTEMSEAWYSFLQSMQIVLFLGVC